MHSGDYSTDFSIFDAGWDVEQAKETMTAVRTQYLVVSSGGVFHVLTREEALPLVLEPAGPTLGEIFGLPHRQPAPTYPPDEAYQHEFGVVIGRNGGPVGVVMRPPQAAAIDEPRRGEGAPPPTAANGGGLGPTRSAGGGDEADPQWVVETTFPSQVEVDTVASLVIELRGGTVEAGPTSMPLAAAEGETIDVVVQAQERLVVEGSADRSITVEPDALPVQVKVRAIEAGPGRIRVLVFKDGVSVGMIKLRPAIVPQGAQDAQESVTSSAEMRAVATGTPPDVTLLIGEEETGAGKAYSIRTITTNPTLGLVSKGWKTEIRTDPRSFVSEMFTDIEGMSLATAEDREIAAHKVSAKGSMLFQQLFPEDLRNDLWQIRDRITRIHIESEEPWIPWEMVRLGGDVDGRFVEGKYLCEYDATRWTTEDDKTPDLSFAKIGVIMPTDSGLSKAAEERAMLHELAGNGWEVEDIPARFIDVTTALASGEYTVLHFSGHGSFRDQDQPDRSRMELEDGQTFSPENLAGATSNLGEASPLVFLNACQIGRAGDALTDLGGWANRFIDAGAAAFVGGLWNVHDVPAFDFASAFYAGLAGGDDLATATRSARDTIRNHGDATWLAYATYGSPNARIA